MVVERVEPTLDEQWLDVAATLIDTKVIDDKEFVEAVEGGRVIRALYRLTCMLKDEAPTDTFTRKVARWLKENYTRRKEGNCTFEYTGALGVVHGRLSYA